MAALRLVTVVLLSGTLVCFAARSLRLWLGLTLLGIAVVLLVPDLHPWLPVAGASVGLTGAVGLVRGAVLLWRRPGAARAGIEKRRQAVRS